MNTFSSLISEDPKQAKQLVDKLSGVCRYVLWATNEQHLITLESELQFIDAYYHLLQTRYNTGIQLSVAVNECQRPGQLPPLTLQLLGENAVKHNVFSPKRPLNIEIFVNKQGRLVVQNTLQRKTTRPGEARAISNGVGLTHIVSMYQMLNLSQPSIEASGKGLPFGCRCRRAQKRSSWSSNRALDKSRLVFYSSGINYACSSTLAFQVCWLLPSFTDLIP